MTTLRPVPAPEELAAQLGEGNDLPILRFPPEEGVSLKDYMAVVEAAAAAHPDVYQIGNTLVKMSPYRKIAEKNSGLSIKDRDPEMLVVNPCNEIQLRVVLGDALQFQSSRGASITPPPQVANDLQKLRDYPAVRVLNGITGCPILHEDGSVTTTQGYDPETGLYFACSTPFPPPPERPTRDDALRAHGKLEELVSEFPWATPTDKATWFASLLTLLTRHLYELAPAFLFDAPMSGSGKTLLAKLISHLRFGYFVGIHPLPEDETEMGKTIVSMLLAGESFIVFDNVDKLIESKVLEGLLTTSLFKKRLLGGNEQFRGDVRIVFAFTGNNSAPGGALARRVLTCRLDPRMAQADIISRKFKVDNIEDHFKAHRTHIVSLALTILRAWAVYSQVWCMTWS